MYRYYGAPAVATSDLEAKYVICEVCKVRCSDIGTLRRHEAGKKHAMNLDLQAENCTMMSNVDKNMPKAVQSGATLDCPRHHEANNCTMSNVDKNIPKVVQTVTCEVCQIECGTTLEDLKRHETCRNHMQAENCTMSNVDENIPKVVQTVTCEVCQIECGTTLDDLRRHETGENHKRILCKLQEENRPMSNLVNKTPAQPATCEVCKRQFVNLKRLRVHEEGKKHKRNLRKLQRSITPEPAKPPNDAVGASTEPAAAAIADGVMPAVQPKKNKRLAASLENLEVKRRRVLEPGSAEGEVKNCTVSNVVKKILEDMQPVTCEVCKMQCNGGLRAHKKGKQHKKNLKKFQDSITPKQENPPNGAVGASTTPAAAADVANGVIPAVQPKKKKRSASTLEDLEVKRRRVIEHGSAEGEVDKANLQQQQQVQQLPIVA